jgi:hypothetical protein
MYYREDVLIDLTVAQSNFQFTVKEDSYFRAYTAAHRIDLDLKLVNASRTLAYGYQYGSTEEAIQSVISAGTYTFQLILFGKYTDIFCETALLEIAIAPKSLYNGFDVCTGQSASAPVLSGLATLSSTSTYTLPANITYRYNYTGVNSQNTVIVSQTFTLTTDSYLQAQLGSNFLLGDIRCLLTSTTNGTVSDIELGYHRRNMHFLDILLPASQLGTSYTTYTLTILTADTQGTGAGIGFPPCATYSLSVTVLPVSQIGPQLCLSSRPFPSTLNTPQNLQTSPKIHLQESFLVPKIDSLYAKETIVWENITTPSYFRLYTEPHHIDIDLRLDENFTTVAQGISFNEEEAIAWILKPGSKYTLTITYYKWYFVDHGNDPCYTYQAELAITPISELNATNCTSSSLPTDLGVAADPIYIENDYYFTQGADPADITVRFQVTATSIFRAAVTYDFVWNDLALRLDIPGSSDPVQGDLDYNRNEISVIQLAAGTYTLHIYEPFSARTLNLRSCVEFHLTLGLEAISSSELDPLLMSCGEPYFTGVWNSPAYLSNLSGNIVDFNQYVLADVTDRSDQFTFVLYTQSVFRMYIPVDPLLDVDVTLYKGSSSIASQVSYGKEESITMSLAPATYTARFTYYGLAQTSVLPPPEACAAFRIEISIYPLAALQAVNSLAQSCTTNFLTQGLIDPTVPANYFNFTRSLETQIYFYSYTLFTVKTTSLFTVLFEQSDVTAGIAMLLQATNISKTYNPLYFQNQIYLNEYLLSGTYNLSFHDPLGRSPLSLLCAPYSLTYSLVPADVPAGVCDADDLPTDLNTTTGGSANFGGPQASLDGSIHFFGDNFAMPKGLNTKNNYILISVKQKSYLRIFLALEPGNAITANLYQNPNLTAAAPIASTVAAGSTDRSNVWILAPQPAYYVLDLYYTTISTLSDCNYYTFELVLEPETSILSGLACPANMPDANSQMPPETINVYSGQDFNVASDFLITSSRYVMNTRNGAYTYTMTLNVASNSTLSAIAAYDFIVNEFVLVLQDAYGNNITVGIHQESPATDSGNNFMNYLQWHLGPGTYRLLLVDVGASTYNLTTFCHYFSFSLSITSNSAGGTPRILQVQPSSGSNLNPNAALSLTVTFSEPATVSLPAGYGLTSYLAEQRIVYLQVSGSSSIVTAVEAYFDLSGTILYLRFVGFGDGQAYYLVLDNTKFVTAYNSTVFTPGNMAVSHYYIMHKCSGCSGHGACLMSGDGTWTCACIGNWTGTNCEKCADGFHAAGVQCVPNTYCNTNSCNTHGSCNAAAGYPVCTCNDGYNGATCSYCAPGYIGYPTCTSNSSDTNDDEACTAPLLPTSLNTPAYLGYAGHVHLQGWYYINLDSRVHETTFNITTPSLFRVYSEPHEIDIDLWLYQVLSETSYSLIAFRITFGLEETIFVQLAPGTYLLRFRYYTWVVPSTDCATFNLELAISPLTSVLAETATSQGFCGALPSIPSLNVTSPYSYSATSFSVSAPTVLSTSANYFYRLNVTISPPANQVATIHATIGYRFLPGDISLLLEAGRKGDHCGNTGSAFSLTPPPGCTYGDNLENVNTLHTFVERGDYILWIYEPIRQLVNVSTCSPFDLSLTIDFVDDEQDIFSCNLPLIPLSLDSTQYAEQPGLIHFRDDFVLDDRTMGFTVAQTSFMRAAITGQDISVALYNAATATVVATYGDTQSISASLGVGTYYLQFTSDIVSFCPVLSIEFALAPVNSITVTCPPGNGNPPSITIITYPFDFGPTRTRPSVDDYYTYNSPNTPVVAAYPFQLAATGFIDASVESDFLRGNLHLELYGSDSSSLVTTGDYNYNANIIQKVLEPGSYELRIVLPPGQRLAALPTCIKYNFELHISYTTSTSPGCESVRLPYTFNTMHYLGYEGAMNFQSENWIIPALSFATFHNINFSVPQPSLIRIYTEPHTIDIDIKILNTAGTVLASGSNAISTEESLTYMLNASTTYIFQLQFYNFYGSYYTIAPCEDFNMEVEIGPVPTRPLICPNQGGSIWPQIPAALTLPYTYNSIDSSIELYYQQVSRSVVSYNFTINLPSATNLHVEIGYNFLVGELVLKLYSVTTRELFRGSNKQDRNIINLLNVPKGQYILTIYEPSYNLDSVVACSAFTFSFYAQEYSALISEERYLVEYYLPSSLDTIAYLLASSKTHLTANFFMFDGTGAHESTSFTVKAASILRVDSLLFDSTIASTHNSAPGVGLYNNAGVFVTAGNGSVLTSLPAGKYTIKFTPPASLTEQNDLGVLVSVQLAIATTSSLQQDLSLAPVTQDCTTTQIGGVQISPSGSYEDGSTSAYVSYSQLTTSNDVANLPFTLDRFSVVYLQVGSLFILSEVQARIYSANSSLEWRGRMTKNTNVIHQALPAGNYIASIRQPVVQSSTISLPHCAIYSYSLIIQDANDAIVDCTTLQALPWQLDTSAGGSSPFGGPIASDGTLHLYGENMHVPLLSNTIINFTLAKVSFMSVLVVGYPSAFSAVDFTMQSNNGTAQAPTQTVASTVDRSRLNLYSLQSSPYQLGIGYRRGSAVGGLCYSYTLQIDIAPAATIQNQVTCPTGITGTPLPTALAVDPTTNYVAGSIDSFFQGWGSVTGLAQSISFTTRGANSNSPTSVIISLSYNSLVTAFSMKLYNSRGALVVTAQTRGQATQSGTTNVYLYLASTITTGNYSLVITHPTADTPFAPAAQVCAPFVFTYEIGTPSPSRVEITDVSPPSVNGLATTENLAVTITFSGTVYATGKIPISSVNSSVIANAFYLAGSDNSVVSPSTAEAIDVRAMKWKITFPSLTSSAVVFSLNLKAYQLFDSVGNAIAIPSPSPYQYTTVNCGAHGSIQGGKCVCNTGYAGSNCDSCDTALGYVQPPNTQICILDQCSPSTCGCFDTSCLAKIGVCSTNASGLAHCACPQNYQGERCESCKAGYGNYPSCTAACNPVCVHGTCTQSNTCTCVGNWVGSACDACPSNFAGDNCDTCASGFSGATCSDYQNTGTSDWDKTKTFLEVTGVLVIVALAAAGAFWYWRYRRAGTRYQLVSRFNMEDDDEETGHHFAQTDNRLVDDEDIPPISRELEEEPRIQLPSGGTINTAPEEHVSGTNNPTRLLDM